MTDYIMKEERLQLQKNFIATKLKKTPLFDKYGLTLVDSNEIIVKSMMGEMRNLVLQFFKGGIYSKKKCEHCGTIAGSQYDRAHDKGKSRIDVAFAALKRVRPDELKPIKQYDFMYAFIEEHMNSPLWYLCSKCHSSYDKKT
jgi:hypothetical protein